MSSIFARIMRENETSLLLAFRLYIVLNGVLLQYDILRA